MKFSLYVRAGNTKCIKTRVETGMDWQGVLLAFLFKAKLVSQLFIQVFGTNGLKAAKSTSNCNKTGIFRWQSDWGMLRSWNMLKKKQLCLKNIFDWTKFNKKNGSIYLVSFSVTYKYKWLIITEIAVLLNIRIHHMTKEAQTSVEDSHNLI